MTIGASTRAAQPATGPSGSRRRRRTQPTTSTRIDILKSAAAAFRKLGYHGATVEQIAAALHMKKGNLYYYFRNKEEILFACHQYSLDRVIELLEEIDRSDAPSDEKLRHLINAFVHTILDELHGTALFLNLEALSPAHLKTVIARRDRFDHGMRQIIADGVGTGAFGPCDPKADLVRDSRRRELDSALVQTGWSRELAGDRRSVCRLPDRGPARITVRLKANNTYNWWLGGSVTW